MIKVTDYMIDRLVHEYGVTDVFMISGGGAMHLNDSVGKQEGLRYICNHHEQAAAIAAEGYSRASGKMAVVIVTTGPGCTNTLTGVMGQWTDSIPVLYISGQVKQETTVEACRDIGLRQLGDQEINIVDIVGKMTKYAEMIKKPQDVKRMLDKAVRLATSGRPGPVWLDVPLDIQGAMVDEETLLTDLEDQDALVSSDKLQQSVNQVIELLKEAKRPVIVAGHGIRLAGAQKHFLELIRHLGIPVLSTFNGFDLIPTDHSQFVGRIGTLGSRAGNFALQNADLLISIGSRNNIRQVSYNWPVYARSAKKVIVDIDEAELNKPTLKPDLAVHADARMFLEELDHQVALVNLPNWSEWLQWGIERKHKYPVVLEEYKTISEDVHPYYFIQQLTDVMPEDQVLVAGNGTACVALFQAGVVKNGQRIFWNSGCASMGYDLPAAIGACFGKPGNDVICLTGEGSLQMNLQELETMRYHQLPLKLIVINNKGYCSIRQTQSNFFNGRYVACDESSGLSFPSMKKLAEAYGMAYACIDSHNGIQSKIEEVLQTKGPVIVDVQLTLDYTFSPKLSSERKPDGTMVSKPLEDLFPFLDREEFKSNMLVPILE